jgi:uncharacterized membrane protein YqaE (UPF0057 family)
MGDIHPLIILILCILLPFIPVYLKKGVTNEFFLNIILCICFWIPGILHALWVEYANGGVF